MYSISSSRYMANKICSSFLSSVAAKAVGKQRSLSSKIKAKLDQRLHQRRYLSYSSVGSNGNRNMVKSKLEMEILEAKANAAPHNSHVQTSFLASLNAISQFDLVIQRVESGQYAIDQHGCVEYITALGASGKMNIQTLTSLSSMLNTQPNSVSTSIPVSPSPSQIGEVHNLQYFPHYATKQVLERGIKASTYQGFHILLTLLPFSLMAAYYMGVIHQSDPSPTTGFDLSPQVHISTKEDKKSEKTFADVIGAYEAKEELEEIVSYLRDPTVFERLGGKVSKGVLLTGPPGNGKTLLAKAVAGEAGVPFFYASASEFEEMYVGVGAKRIRDLFQKARNHKPCIIFIDELDAIGGGRDADGSNYSRMTLNQLLVELDGFVESEGVVVIAATNLPSALDKALIRPGRFDRTIFIPLPDIKARMEILGHYTKNVPKDRDVNLDIIARATSGLSAAELENIVNTAAVRASVAGKPSINMDDLVYAKDKVIMGPERKSAVIPDEVKVNTAYHESGHALVALFTPGAKELHQVTIIPRGEALGMNQFL